ncbi:TPA: hypothetical protein ACKRIR_002941 [Proteus mirabilis]
MKPPQDLTKQLNKIIYVSEK